MPLLGRSKLTKGPLKSLGGDDESIGASCVTHSFAAGTKVLLSDGTTEPIQDVKVGDEVENAQPGGRTEHHRVDEIHKTLTDKDFTDLTVTTPTGTTTITGTQNHPYYDLTAGRFVNAADLSPGDRLQTTGGNVVVSVLAVRNYTASMVATGEILKWGITDNVFKRYDMTDFANWTNEYGGGYQMTILKNFDSEAAAAGG